MEWPSRRIWWRAGATATLGLAGIAAAAPAVTATAASAAGHDVGTGAAPSGFATVMPADGADGERPADPAATATRPLALQASLAALRARMQPWRPVSGQADGGAALHRGLGIQIVELPREGAPIGPPPKRAHHALSIGMAGPKQMLRGLGLDATECAGRFRMPSRLNRKGDGSTQLDVSAQLGMACKF